MEANDLTWFIVYCAVGLAWVVATIYSDIRQEKKSPMYNREETMGKVAANSILYVCIAALWPLMLPILLLSFVVVSIGKVMFGVLEKLA